MGFDLVQPAQGLFSSLFSSHFVFLWNNRFRMGTNFTLCMPFFQGGAKTSGGLWAHQTAILTCDNQWNVFPVHVWYCFLRTLDNAKRRSPGRSRAAEPLELPGGDAGGNEEEKLKDSGFYDQNSAQNECWNHLCGGNVVHGGGGHVAVDVPCDLSIGIHISTKRVEMECMSTQAYSGRFQDTQDDSCSQNEDPIPSPLSPLKTQKWYLCGQHELNPNHRSLIKSEIILSY